MSQDNTVTLKLDILSSSVLNVRVTDGRKPVWVSKSQIMNLEELDDGMKKVEVEMTTWAAKEGGLIDG